MTAFETPTSKGDELRGDSPKRLAQMALIGFVLACIGLFVIASMMPEDTMEPGGHCDSRQTPVANASRIAPLCNTAERGWPALAGFV